MGGEVYLELSSAGSTASYARGQVEPDRDDDGATDREETQLYMTNPLDRDTDDDGVLDGEESRRLGLAAWLAKACDPLKVDSDGDGLADALELGLTTATLENRQTTCTKTLTWWGGGSDGQRHRRHRPDLRDAAPRHRAAPGRRRPLDRNRPLQARHRRSTASGMAPTSGRTLGQQAWC